MPSDHLLATVSALQNGLTSLPLGSAMDNTETWQQQFLQSGEPGLQDIAREIGNLQSLLTSGALSATAIGNSLTMLGDQTSQVSAQAPADLKKPLWSWPTCCAATAATCWPTPTKRRKK